MRSSPKLFAALFAAIPALAGLVSTPALAHGDGHVAAGTNPWTMWQFSPEIVLGLVVAGIVYWRGSHRGLVAERWRILAFNAGLLALAIALLSPVERLADHIFAVHQVEHMLLRTLAPMLIFLSLPQASLVRGLPPGVSRAVAGRGWLRHVMDMVRKPVVATVLFLAASWLWMLPRFHDRAILDAPIHYLWHVSLLASGLVFFSVIFDRRSAPQGPGLGARLAMFVFAALGNILLGAFLTFKTAPLYSAYELTGHMWQVSMLTDEQTGGIVMWIPGTMMFAIAAMIVIHRFAREEERLTDRRRRSGRALVVQRQGANRALALGLAAFALLMLAITVSVVAVIDHPPSAARDFGLAGHVPG